MTRDRLALEFIEADVHRSLCYYENIRVCAANVCSGSTPVQSHTPSDGAYRECPPSPDIQVVAEYQLGAVMVAVCNRADHYIFAL